MAKPSKELLQAEKLQLEDDLRNWRNLRAVVMKSDEEWLQKLLKHEMATKGRKLFLQSIYGRYSKLRYKREQADIMSAAKEA